MHNYKLEREVKNRADWEKSIKGQGLHWTVVPSKKKKNGNEREESVVKQHN